MIRCGKLRFTGMKLTGSARKNTKSSAFSSDPRKGDARFVGCVRSTGYPASLELRKLYRRLSGDQGSRLGPVRRLDEAGGDYVYPGDDFHPVNVPPTAP